MRVVLIRPVLPAYSALPSWLLGLLVENLTLRMRSHMGDESPWRRNAQTTTS